MNWYKSAKWKDQIPGGLADKDKPSDFNEEQIAKGTKVEMEHTDDPKKAKEIAMDHLKEDPKYYDKLETIEPQHKEARRRRKNKFNPFSRINMLAYQLGYLAHGDHLNNACPYRAGTEQRRAWNAGWNAAERDD